MLPYNVTDEFFVAALDDIHDLEGSSVLVLLALNAVVTRLTRDDAIEARQS